MTRQGSFWSFDLLPLKLASAVYVLAIPLSHGLLPHSLVWSIAVVFLWLMLLPYPIAAHRCGTGGRVENTVSAVLAIVGGLGLLFSPWLIVAAIFAHGAWDLAKHNNWGTPFVRWYLSGCAVVDVIYGGALTIYLLQTGSGG